MRTAAFDLGDGLEVPFREPTAAEWIRFESVQSLDEHLAALDSLLVDPGSFDFDDLTMSDIRDIDRWLARTFARAPQSKHPFEEFGHRLALELGIWDVDALLEAIPVSKLLRWLAFYDRDPWGSAADDYRLALSRFSSLEPYLTKKSRLDVRDLLPGWRQRNRPRKKRKPEALDRAASQTAAIFGALTAKQRIALAEGRPVN